MKSQIDRWAMNDGGSDLSASATVATEGRLGWLQVELRKAADTFQYPLPIFPLFDCLRHALDRLGHWELDAVQLLVPLREVLSAWSGVGSPDWLSQLTPPTARRRVALTIEFSSLDAANRLLIETTLRDHWLVSSVTADPSSAISCSSHIRENWWVTDSSRQLTITVDMPEWTADSAAWLLRLVVGLLQKCGAETPVMIAATADKGDTETASRSTVRR